LFSHYFRFIVIFAFSCHAEAPLRFRRHTLAIFAVAESAAAFRHAMPIWSFSRHIFFADDCLFSSAAFILPFLRHITLFFSRRYADYLRLPAESVILFFLLLFLRCLLLSLLRVLL